MLTNLKLLLGITSSDYDTLLTYLLTVATDLAKRTLYPFDDTETVVLSPKYNTWIVQAAQQLYQSLGSEQIKAYSENGLSITYQDIQSGISGGLLNQLIPNAKALG